MYKDTITLFNQYKTSDGIIWYPHIIKNINLNCDKASILKAYGADSNDNAKLHVNYKVLDNDIVIGTLKYKKPKEWEKCIDVQDCITFRGGNNFDFFLVGEYDTSPIVESDYISSKNEGFYDYMNSKYDDVFTISSVGMYSLIPHFEIMAR